MDTSTYVERLKDGGICFLMLLSKMNILTVNSNVKNK